MEAIYGLGKDFIFKEAVKFLKEKRVLPEEEYMKLDEECHAKAFSVSGYTSLEVLQTVLDTLVKAAEEGQTKEQFREQVNSFLTENGYKGMNAWKSDTIFRTNMQTAFNAGHYKSMTEPTTLKLRPYWKYVTAGDNVVRDAHAVMAGRVFAADDPIWDVWYPPNGFRCRCIVVSLTKKQVERLGLTVETMAPAFPDTGFSGNPAKKEWQPDISKMSEPLQKIYADRDKDTGRT